MPIIYGCKETTAAPVGVSLEMWRQKRGQLENAGEGGVRNKLCGTGCCEGVAYVSPGCCYKCHRLGGFNNKLSFLTAGRQESPRSRCHTDRVSSESPRLGLHSSPYILIKKEGGGKIPVSSCKGSNPIIGAPPSWNNHLPKVSAPNTIPAGISISIYRFCRDTCVQSIAVLLLAQWFGKLSNSFRKETLTFLDRWRGAWSINCSFQGG